VVGTSSAARVSIGSKHDDWAGLAVKGRQLKRHPTERVTVTVVIYNAVAGGVPSEADVVAAIDDMEQLYASTTGGSGRLVDCAFDVFKNGGSSSSSSPPTPPPPVMNASQFPTAGPLPPPAPFVRPPGGGTAGAEAKMTAHKNAPDVVKEVVDGKVDESESGFSYVHDTLALPWLQAGVGGGRIGEAYHAFRVANDIHMSMKGLSSATTLYNIACCLAVAARDDPTGVLRSSGMLGEAAKSQNHDSFVGLRDRGLAASLQWLKQARAAGYSNISHMNSDPDLSELRKKYGAL